MKTPDYNGDACLVLVAHQLHDDANVFVEILGGDHAHDVAGVCCVRILAAWVDHDEARVGRLELLTRKREKSKTNIKLSESTCIS